MTAKKKSLPVNKKKVNASGVKKAKETGGRISGNKSFLPQPVIGLTGDPDIGVTATISAVFTNTNPGTSKLTATLNNQSKSISSSGGINFSGVKSLDIILVQVNSLGTSDITIDIPADPASFHFSPGSHSGEFEIK